MSGNYSPSATSETDPADKNFWATQWHCFHDAEMLYGRRLEFDVAAMAHTSKVPGKYYGPDHKSELYRDSLAADLPWPEHWWCNPPFDRKQDFIVKAIEQQGNGRPGMMLLPYEPASVWWQELLATGVIVYEPAGRYNFYEADGVTPKTGVNFPSALVCFPTHRLRDSVRIPYQKSFPPRQKRNKRVDTKTATE